MPTVNIEGFDIEINVTHFSPYVPARLNCLPENATPEEGHEIEWEVDEDQEYALIIQAGLEANAVWEDSVSEQLLEMASQGDL